MKLDLTSVQKKLYATINIIPNYQILEKLKHQSRLGRGIDIALTLQTLHWAEHDLL